MRTTGIGTSLILIATGAVLAFAVDYRVTGININAVGAILLIVGIIGLVLSMLMQGELFGMPTSTTTRRRVVYDEPVEHVHEEPTYTTDVHTHPVP
jgi:hypothetical protein